MALENLAGYSLRRGLGSGSVGAVWLVRNLGSGRHAVLKRIPTAAITDVQAFRDDLALTQRIDHPHVAELIELRQTDRDWLIFSQYIPAGTLTGLLERRGPLSLGELVTLLSPLAQAVDALHRAGLTHGRLSLANVMFDADGRPILTDTGLRSLADPADQADDRAALRALALAAGGDPDLFTPALFASAPVAPALVAPGQIAPGQVSLGQADTDEADLSHRILSLAPPEPINLGLPAEPHTLGQSAPPARTPARAKKTVRAKPRRGRSTRRRTNVRRPATPWAVSGHGPNGLVSAVRQGMRQRSSAYGILAAAGLAAVMVLVIGLITVGLLGRPTGGPAAAAPNQPPTSATHPTTPTSATHPTTPTSATHPTPPTSATHPTPPTSTTHTAPPTSTTRTTTPNEPAHAWLATLQALDARRSQAFRTLDQASLDQIYVPGSSPWSSDHALIADYRSRDLRIEGLRLQIDTIAIEQPGKQTVVLRVVDRLVSGAVVDSAGNRTPLPAGAPTTRRITLTAIAATWRITAISTA